MRLLDALAGRWLFLPSRQLIDCRKQQRLLVSGARRIDVRVDGSTQAPRLFLLRFLGARGRAEHGTRDPLNRFDPFPGEVWIANPPGFGQTSGRPSPEDYCSDALCVFDALRERAGDAPIWVQGQSLGTLAALHVAANRAVDWLILRNVTPAALVAGRYLPALAGLAGRCLPAGFDALRSAGQARADALFVTARMTASPPPTCRRASSIGMRGASSSCLWTADTRTMSCPKPTRSATANSSRNAWWPPVCAERAGL